MKKSLWKDIVRDIWNNRGQFVSIVLILALGVSFFIGIQITGFYMRESGNRYFNEQEVANVQVTTSLGVGPEVQEWLQSEYPGSVVEPVFYHDVLVQRDESQLAIRLYRDDNTLTKHVLIEGNHPESVDEIVLDDMLREFFNFEIGDTVTLLTDEDLTISEFEVVGFARSSNYLDAFRGNTTLGNGVLEGFGIVEKDVFKEQEIAPAIALRFDNIDQDISYSDEYEEQMEVIIDDLESRKDEIAQVRYDSITLEPSEELADAQRELDGEIKDALDELNEAQLELDDARNELNEAMNTFNDGVTQIYEEIDQAPKIYSNHRLTASTLKSEVNRFQSSSRTELNDGLSDIEEGLLEIEKGEKELIEAQQEIEKAYGQMDTLMDTMSQFTSGLEALDQIRGHQSQISGQIRSLRQQQSALLDNLAGINAELVPLGLGSDLNGNAGDFDLVLGILEPLVDLDPESPTHNPQINETYYGIIAMRDGYLEIEENMPLLSGALSELSETQRNVNDEINSGIEQVYTEMGLEPQISSDAKQSYEDLNENLDIVTTIAELDRAQQRINENTITLNENKEELLSLQVELLETQTTMEDGFITLNEGVSELEDGASQLMNGLSEINEGQVEIEEGFIEVEEARLEAQTEIDDGLKELHDLEMPTTFILERSDFIGSYDALYNDSLRIENIGRVFPMFFFLIAALVTLTTIRRMVDDQTQLMGVYKALGYSNRDIQKKFLVFAGSTFVIGVALGAWFGYTLLPNAIFNAYRILYQIPDIVPTFNVSYFWLPAVFSFVATVGIAYFNSNKSLKIEPATLMRPKSPPSGKRVFLEKIGFIWKRLGFLQKVTIRNLARNKSRFFMTVAGIAGCMGLLITGFGINDSIMGIPEMQFNEFQQYDVQVIYDPDTVEYDMLTQKLDEHPIDYGYDGMIFNSEVGGLDTNVTIFKESKGLDALFNLYSIETDEEVVLSDNGIILTEKASILLNLDVGDEVQLVNRDKEMDVPLRIEHIVKNYAGNNVYMSQEYAEKVGIEIEMNAILLEMDESTSENISALSESALEAEGVLTIINRLELMDSINQSMEAFYAVIVIIIIAAGALAFIVMYNLSSLNIQERQRELATLKVLGFYPNETGQYVFRENVILVLIGMLVGIVFGIILHGYVIITVELDSIMFVREIKWQSIMYAIILTVLFTGINEIIMRRRINEIDMLSALKSVE